MRLDRDKAQTKARGVSISLSSIIGLFGIALLGGCSGTKPQQVSSETKITANSFSTPTVSLPSPKITPIATEIPQPSPTPLDPEDEDYKQALANGRAEVSSMRFSNGIKLLNQAYQLKPKELDVNLALFEAYSQAGQTNAALPFAKAIISLSPGTAEASRAEHFITDSMPSPFQMALKKINSEPGQSTTVETIGLNLGGTIIVSVSEGYKPGSDDKSGELCIYLTVTGSFGDGDGGVAFSDPKSWARFKTMVASALQWSYKLGANKGQDVGEIDIGAGRIVRLRAIQNTVVLSVPAIGNRRQVEAAMMTTDVKAFQAVFHKLP